MRCLEFMLQVVDYVSLACRVESLWFWNLVNGWTTAAEWVVFLARSAQVYLSYVFPSSILLIKSLSLVCTRHLMGRACLAEYLIEPLLARYGTSECNWRLGCFLKRVSIIWVSLLCVWIFMKFLSINTWNLRCSTDISVLIIGCLLHLLELLLGSSLVDFIIFQVLLPFLLEVLHIFAQIAPGAHLFQSMATFLFICANRIEKNGLRFGLFLLGVMQSSRIVSRSVRCWIEKMCWQFTSLDVVIKTKLPILILILVNLRSVSFSLYINSFRPQMLKLQHYPLITI